MQSKYGYKETKLDRFNRMASLRMAMRDREPLPDTCCVALVVTAAVVAGVGVNFP